MADLGVIGVRTTAVITMPVLNFQPLSGMVLLAPTPYPLTYATFPNQSEPNLTNYPASRLQLGF